MRGKFRAANTLRPSPGDESPEPLSAHPGVCRDTLKDSSHGIGTEGVRNIGPLQIKLRKAGGLLKTPKEEQIRQALVSVIRHVTMSPTDYVHS
jgi:hypothetical protein